ncbi:F510_1955 family glycosylhydrolase [Streptomyces sp. HNM0574]|uniref:F510_1955 family glycosylhydrolase n=1 Tax=Streptomyces sp. HNM0574 TaxID=2714954 RepID=UPI00146A35FB|nr:exo-alpha-sialidase [Streptomyces sp. HNM0574]NLU69457.1 exo-alpha-sialidase [Streptomyces sp. HNM0574]
MNLPLRAAAAAAGALLLTATLTACSTGPEDSGASDAKADGPAVSHVHGLGIDPADDRLYVATHHGVVSVAEDGTAKRVSEDEGDYMGFTVVKDKTFLGSGHPAPGTGEPANRGLIRSEDSGKTWKTLSLGGDVDFHSLKYAHGSVYGYDNTNGMLRVSENGTDWDDRARLAALDIAVHPEDPDTVLATTEAGVAKSTDGGEKFGTGAKPVLAFLSWPEPKALFGISPEGELRRSSDSGESWKTVGTPPGGAPQALTALDSRHLLVATGDGVYESRDGGESFDKRLAVTGEQ